MLNDPEVMVLAGIVANPKWITSATLKFDDFRSPEQRLLYIGLWKYHQDALDQGKDLYANAQVLERYLDEIATGKARKLLPHALQRLRAIPNEAGNVDWHSWQDASDVMQRHGIDCRAVDGLKKIVDDFVTKGASDQAVRDQVMALYHDLDSGGVVSRGVDVASHTGELLAGYDARKALGDKGRIATGHPRLDKLASAKPGRFWIWAAYTGGGKSIFGRELSYATMWQGRNVLFVTGEMSEREVAEALVVRHSHSIHGGPLNWRAVDDGTLTPDQELVFRKSLHDLRSNKQYGKFFIWKPPGRATLNDIKARAMQYNADAPLDLIVFDYLSLFRASGKDVWRMPKHQQVMELCEEAQSFALDFDNNRGIWVIGLHQVSRSGYENALKRGHYVLNDLAESSGIERNAALVGFNFLNDDLRDMHEVKLSIAKNRFGPTLHQGWAAVEEFAHSRIAVLT